MRQALEHQQLVCPTQIPLDIILSRSYTLRFGSEMLAGVAAVFMFLLLEALLTCAFEHDHAG
jgi:hypothetical protein